MSSTGSPPSATAERILELLRPHTPFAEAIVKRQAERAGLTLQTIDGPSMAKLGPMILVAAAVFVDPAGLAELKQKLPR